MLNDLESLGRLCRSRGIEMCVDAISSLGTVPCDLREVAFATGVSGKGLGAYPGIALVFHREPPNPRGNRLPRYLDLALYAHEAGCPFTHSSNLLAALSRALDGIASRYTTLSEDAAYLRQQAEAAGLRVAVPAGHAAPCVLTFALPRVADGARVAERLAASGYAIAYASAYLAERNWIQVALMGDYARHRLPEMMAALRQAVQVHGDPQHNLPKRALPHG
jgi:aspartate aminotransferase-like enzyme